VTAADEEAALPVDMQARLARMADTIRQHGLLNLPRDWLKPLGGKLWELRITGKDGIARAIFVKKTQKTPQRELELARQRAKEVR
jgi:phage-related protein